MTDRPRRLPSWGALLRSSPLRRSSPAHLAHPAEDTRSREPPPSPELLEFFRRLGVALCSAGHTTDRVTSQMHDLANAYGVHDVRFFVLPTGLFVGVGPSTAGMVDFAAIDRKELRLDQIDDVHRLLEEATSRRIPPLEGVERLNRILAAPPRFSPVVRVAGHVVLTVGLALVLRSNGHALAGSALLGGLVGLLQMVATRFRVVAVATPVVAAAAVTAVGFEWSDALSGGYPAQLLIPPLVTYLPGAALTLGTIELATGSMVAGASRLVYGLNGLFLLLFGVLVGGQITGVPDSLAHPPDQLGWWAPWVGVLVFGLGHFLFSPAPRHSLPWLLGVLYATWIIQYVTGQLVSGQFSAFAGGMALIPITYAVERVHNAPASQVTFLPAFWLLVPGALGLTGLSQFVAVSENTGLANIISTLLTVMAIALGVLVGSSITHSAMEHLEPEAARQPAA